jgi:RimJ/RimL family protein N-acetyltransferase
MVFPRYFRFPFMGFNDLQFGDIWTHPAHRGQGLGQLGLSAALAYAWQPGRKLWYLTEMENIPSQKLAEAAGFRRWGEGVRTARLGVGFLGQFVVTCGPENVR